MIRRAATKLRSRAQRSFPGVPLGHPEPLVAVEPRQLFVVQPHALTRQENVRSPVTEPPLLTGQEPLWRIGPYGA